MTWLWIGADGPHMLPGWASEYLLTKLKVANPSSLDCVEQITYKKNVLLSLIRIFDQRMVPDDIQIENFISFDKHPELILYEGYRENATGKVYIETVQRPASP